MAAFLFQVELPEFNDDIEAIVPVHREHINKLFSEGRILSYSVSASRNMLWCVINAEDEQEANAMVLAFPIYQYVVDVTCHPLLFHNTLPVSMPGISLN